MGLNQVEDASSEFSSGVQIVSPPPDQIGQRPDTRYRVGLIALVRTDFNNWVGTELLILGAGSVRELQTAGISPRKGLFLRVYEQDFDANDLPDYLVADGELVTQRDSWALRSDGSTHVSDLSAEHWARSVDWDAEDRRRGFPDRRPGRSGLWGESSQEPTLEEAVDRLSQLLRIWADARGAELPEWTTVRISEEAHGRRVERWHDIMEFSDRFAEIRRSATRDWVNLHAEGVEEGVLRIVVEYKTDGPTRPETSRYVNLSGPEEQWWEALPRRKQ